MKLTLRTGRGRLHEIRDDYARPETKPAMVFAPYLKAKKPSPIEKIAAVRPPVYRPAKGRRPKIDPLPALGVEFKETSDE